MPMGQPYPKPDPRSPRRGRQQPKPSKKVAPRKPATAPKRVPRREDAWTKNDELLYKLMGGKSKTRYAEDQATYREFGRTYGGPTDAASVAMRKRRERGDWSFGEKPVRKKIKNNNKDNLLFSLGFAKKGKPRKGVKKIKSKAPKNVKRGVK